MGRQLPTRLVVKVGSSSLTRADGGLDLNRIDRLAGALAGLVGHGHEVLLVSSGAVAAGLAPLGMRRRPSGIVDQQAAAAVGQGLLVAQWRQAFQAYHHHVAQVLLTTSDVTRRSTYVTVRECLRDLIARGVIPVINENDAVATDEIRFGDNDRLAALVAQAIEADLLVLLTDVDGLYDRPPSQPSARLIDRVESWDDVAVAAVSGAGSSVGTGGMVTKLEAAKIAWACGIPTLVTAADRVEQMCAGESVGTYFVGGDRRPGQRLAWVAYAASVDGTVEIDAGALDALRRHGSSLLAAGVTAVSGDFRAGSVVALVHDGAEVGRGVASVDVRVATAMMGLRMGEMAAMGIDCPRPLIHRDDLVLYASPRP